MTELSAPYRFVPLSPLIMLPDWADLVSHDMPFADGVSGELAYTLQTHTRLCVGGRQTASSEHQPGEVYFYRTPDGVPAIPGTSLKGMLRNVLEIASFARFNQVEEQQLGVRDISESNNFYCQTMVRKPSRAGWLSYEDGQWRLRACRFSRLHQRDLVQWLKVDDEQWKRAGKVRERYAMIGLLPQLQFEMQPKPNRQGQMLANPDPKGPVCGRVVVTGQPGQAYDKGSKAKKYEFVFHDAEDGQLVVAADVMAGFSRIHEDSDEWIFWRQQMTTGCLELGIPVFYHATGDKVESLGLAYMYKLPYSNSLHQAIAHTHQEHLSQRCPDLPDLLFGTLGADDNTPLRGRVNIGMALAEESGMRCQLGEPVILNGPKPTFYPAYIRQQERGSFKTLMDNDAELAGWKRYPVRPVEHAELPAKAGNRVKVRLETAEEGSKFLGRIRFHNLRKVELGALLWALDFGSRPGLRHGLGMGKPLGYGQTSIQLHDARLRPNADDAPPNSNWRVYLMACQQSFVELMDQVLRASGDQHGWENCGPIKSLLDMAKPSATASGYEYLPEPKAFLPFKKIAQLQEVVQTFHGTEPARPEPRFDTSIPHGYQDHFDDRLADAADRLGRIARKQEAAAKKADATEEQALLIDIGEQLLQCQTAVSKTALEKLNNGLRIAWDTMMNMDGAERAGLALLVEEASLIDNKKIQKICRKLNGEVTS